MKRRRTGLPCASRATTGGVQPGKRRRITHIVIGAILVVLLGAGTSYAYFVSRAAGSSDAGVGNLQSVTVGTAGTPASPMLPGGRGDLDFNVTNTNGSPITLINVAMDGLISPDPSHLGCTTTDGNPVVVVAIPPGDLPVTIPADSTKTVELADATTMDVAATSNCQGASFSIPLTFTVQR